MWGAIVKAISTAVVAVSANTAKSEDSYNRTLSGYACNPQNANAPEDAKPYIFAGGALLILIVLTVVIIKR
jgi:hypothetical protein